MTVFDNLKSWIEAPSGWGVLSLKHHILLERDYCLLVHLFDGQGSLEDEVE